MSEPSDLDRDIRDELEDFSETQFQNLPLVLRLMDAYIKSNEKLMAASEKLSAQLKRAVLDPPVEVDPTLAPLSPSSAASTTKLLSTIVNNSNDMLTSTIDPKGTARTVYETMGSQSLADRDDLLARKRNMLSNLRKIKDLEKEAGSAPAQTPTSPGRPSSPTVLIPSKSAASSSPAVISPRGKSPAATPRAASPTVSTPRVASPTSTPPRVASPQPRVGSPLPRVTSPPAFVRTLSPPAVTSPSSSLPTSPRSTSLDSAALNQLREDMATFLHSYEDMRYRTWLDSWGTVMELHTLNERNLVTKLSELRKQVDDLPAPPFIPEDTWTAVIDKFEKRLAQGGHHPSGGTDEQPKKLTKREQKEREQKEREQKEREQTRERKITVSATKLKIKDSDSPPQVVSPKAEGVPESKSGSGKSGSRISSRTATEMTQGTDSIDATPSTTSTTVTATSPPLASPVFQGAPKPKEGSVWKLYVTDDGDDYYYFNPTTGASVWELPPEDIA